jgi:hypothetical protein
MWSHDFKCATVLASFIKSISICFPWITGISYQFLKVNAQVLHFSWCVLLELSLAGHAKVNGATRYLSELIGWAGFGPTPLPPTQHEFASLFRPVIWTNLSDYKCGVLTHYHFEHPHQRTSIPLVCVEFMSWAMQRREWPIIVHPFL